MLDSYPISSNIVCENDKITTSVNPNRCRIALHKCSGRCMVICYSETTVSNNHLLLNEFRNIAQPNWKKVVQYRFVTHRNKEDISASLSYRYKITEYVNDKKRFDHVLKKNSLASVVICGFIRTLLESWKIILSDLWLNTSWYCRLQ